MVYARNYIPHSVVEVGNRYERTTGADLFAKVVDLVHQPVEALLPLIVDQAKRTAKDLIQTSNSHNLKEGKALFVGLVSIVIHLNTRIQSPLLLTEVVDLYKTL